MPAEGLWPDDKILSAHHALAEAGVPHAFGGAIALGYASEPRGTKDIDVNVFLSEDNAAEVLAVAASIGVEFEEKEAVAEVRRTGQIRLWWSQTALDLFFAYAPFHQSCSAHVRIVPFDGETIPIISGEDLVVFKALFDRGKDWSDIEMVLRTQGSKFDLGYVRTWLEAMVGADNSRLARLAALAAEIGPG